MHAFVCKPNIVSTFPSSLVQLLSKQSKSRSVSQLLVSCLLSVSEQPGAL